MPRQHPPRNLKEQRERNKQIIRKLLDYPSDVEKYSGVFSIFYDIYNGAGKTNTLIDLQWMDKKKIAITSLSYGHLAEIDSKITDLHSEELSKYKFVKSWENLHSQDLSENQYLKDTNDYLRNFIDADTRHKWFHKQIDDSLEDCPYSSQQKEIMKGLYSKYLASFDMILKNESLLKQIEVLCVDESDALFDFATEVPNDFINNYMVAKYKLMPTHSSVAFDYDFIDENKKKKSATFELNVELFNVSDKIVRTFEEDVNWALIIQQIQDFKDGKLNLNDNEMKKLKEIADQHSWLSAKYVFKVKSFLRKDRGGKIIEQPEWEKYYTPYKVFTLIQGLLAPRLPHTKVIITSTRFNNVVDKALFDFTIKLLNDEFVEKLTKDESDSPYPYYNDDVTRLAYLRLFMKDKRYDFTKELRKEWTKPFENQIMFVYEPNFALTNTQAEKNPVIYNFIPEIKDILKDVEAFVLKNELPGYEKIKRYDYRQHGRTQFITFSKIQDVLDPDSISHNQKMKRLRVRMLENINRKNREKGTESAKRVNLGDFEHCIRSDWFQNWFTNLYFSPTSAGSNLSETVRYVVCYGDWYPQPLNVKLSMIKDSRGIVMDRYSGTNQLGSGLSLSKEDKEYLKELLGIENIPRDVVELYWDMKLREYIEFPNRARNNVNPEKKIVLVITNYFRSAKNTNVLKQILEENNITLYKVFPLQIKKPIQPYFKGKGI